MKRTSLVFMVMLVVTIIAGCATLIEIAGMDQLKSKSTTTAASSSTTTTNVSPGSNTISGTITGLQFGSLYVVGSGNKQFSGTPFTFEVIFISTGETSKAYTLSGFGNGTYYVGALLNLNRWTTQTSLETGAKLGQYANGYLPANYGKSPSADPDPISISGSAQTGKNFDLKITY